MGIDSKDIQCFVRKIARFSMDACSTFVQRHPRVSGVGLLFFLLYILFPSVFYFLICNSPVIVTITVYFRIYFKPKRPEIQNVERVDEKSAAKSNAPVADAVVVSKKSDKPVIRTQMSRRKIHRLEVESVKEDKGMSLAANPVDAFIVGNQNVITGEKGGHSLDHGESYSTNVDVKNVQGKDDFAGKTSINEEKPRGLMEMKGSASLDGGESSRQNPFAAQKNKAHVDSMGKSSLSVPAAENFQALDQSDSALCAEPLMADLISQKECGELSEKGTADGGGEEEGESSESDDEEGAQQNGNNAVQWTEDDQQNLMDLGNSELERNKRLESLIARRRARKLYKMALEKRMDVTSGPAAQILQISTVKNSLLNVHNNQDFLECPGSAPSVLPSRNPFDIPYDPYEEKPILTGDSFDQEFMAANQRDLFYCRHESFLYGPSFSFDPQQDQNNPPFSIDKRAAHGLRFNRSRTASGMSAHDDLIDKLLASQGGSRAVSPTMSTSDLIESESQTPKQSEKPVEIDSGDRCEFQEETDSTRDNSSEPCSFASDEASEVSLQGNRSANIGNLEPKVGKYNPNLSDRIKSSLTFTIPEALVINGPCACNPSVMNKTRIEDNLFFRDKGPCPSPGYSIASDLQVEVSELGSPPADVESSYDEDAEKEVPYGNDEMWGASTQLSGVEENKSKSREVNEGGEGDTVDAGFSAIKKNLQNSTASLELPLQEAEQDMSNTNVLSAARNEKTEKDHTHSEKLENVKQFLQAESSDASSSENPESAMPPMESVSHPTSEASSEKSGGLSNVPETSAEVNATLKVHDQAVHAYNDNHNLKSTEEKDDSPQIPIRSGASLPQTDEKIISESSKDIRKNSDKPVEQEAIKDSENQVEENKNPNFIEEDPPKLNEQEVGGTSMMTQVQDSLKAIQDSEDKQNAAEAGVSGVNQSLLNPILSVPPRVFVAEQLSSINSSSCSSPRSVLPRKVQIHEVSLSSFQQQIKNDVPQSIVGGVVRNNSLDGMSSRSSTLSAPTNSHHLVADPIDHPSTSSSITEPSAEAADSIILEAARDIHPKKIEIKSQTLDENTAGMSTSKPEVQIVNSNNRGIMVKEKDEIVKPPKPAEGTNSMIIEARDEHQKKLTEDESTAGPSNSVEGHESSSVTKDDKDITDLPKLADSEDDLKTIKDSVPAAESAVRKEPSKFLPESSKGNDISSATKDDICEPNDLIKDNATMDELTKDKIAVEQSRPIESEVKAPKEETYTSV